MKIDVLGSGSAFAKSKNTAAITVTDAAGKMWLVDCGPTIPRALFNRNLPLDAIQVIYFSHIHPDHCAGLPALINYWKSFQRSAPLTIICQPEHRAALQSIACLGYWPEQTTTFEIQWLDTEDSFSWQGWQLQTAETQHEISNRAILFSVDNQRLFYSGDGRPTKASRALMKDADLAFQECACFTELAADDSHGDFVDCQKLAEELQINRLGLYHCWDEEVDKIRAAVAGNEKQFVSEDGLQLDLSRL
ncbi:MBL fold metallo-hydrolase [Reinekea thalattae]|uniref:Ribonuclease Z n=1 Tax=Reinekea thalattae TaxID=2593301 RepID=A0A5C8Z9G2_9GAMM|nr:MBL fold metallo-hydrolase [Reinekea thalattae]TXR53919.1 ribonuclease Z [Reinekea thalattae]